MRIKRPKVTNCTSLKTVHTFDAACPKWGHLKINFKMQLIEVLHKVSSHLSQSPEPANECESNKLTASCPLACSWSSWPCNPRPRDLMPPRHTEINTTSYIHPFQNGCSFCLSYHKLFPKSCVFFFTGVPELIILLDCIIWCGWCHFKCVNIETWWPNSEM